MWWMWVVWGVFLSLCKTECCFVYVFFFKENIKNNPSHHSHPSHSGQTRFTHFMFYSVMIYVASLCSTLWWLLRNTHTYMIFLLYTPDDSIVPSRIVHPTRSARSPRLFKYFPIFNPKWHPHRTRMMSNDISHTYMIPHTCRTHTWCHTCRTHTWYFTHKEMLCWLVMLGMILMSL